MRFNLNIQTREKLRKLLPDLIISTSETYEDDPVILKYNNYHGRQDQIHLDQTNSQHLEVFYPEAAQQITQIKERVDTKIDSYLGKIRLPEEFENADEIDISLYDNSIEKEQLDEITSSTETIEGEPWATETTQEYSVVETQRGPVIIGNTYREFAMYRKDGKLIDLLTGEEIDKNLTKGINPLNIYHTAEKALSNFHDILGTPNMKEKDEKVIEKDPTELYQEIMAEEEYEARTVDAKFNIGPGGYNPSGHSCFESDEQRAEKLFLKLEDIADFHANYEEQYNKEGKLHDIPITPMRDNGTNYKFRLTDNDVSIVTRTSEKTEDYAEIEVLALNEHETIIDQF